MTSHNVILLASGDIESHLWDYFHYIFIIGYPGIRQTTRLGTQVRNYPDTATLFTGSTRFTDVGLVPFTVQHCPSMGVAMDANATCGSSDELERIAFWNVGGPVDGCIG